MFGGVDLPSLFPNVVAWIDRCLLRPGTKRGFAVPQESQISNAALLKKLNEDPEAKQKLEETMKLLAESKAQYNYKYASP